MVGIRALIVMRIITIVGTTLQSLNRQLAILQPSPTKAMIAMMRGLPVEFQSTASTVRDLSRAATDLTLMSITRMITMTPKTRPQSSPGQEPPPAVGRVQEAARGPTTPTQPPGGTAGLGVWRTVLRPRQESYKYK